MQNQDSESLDDSSDIDKVQKELDEVKRIRKKVTKDNKKKYGKYPK